MSASKRRQRGQVLALVAVLLPAMVLGVGAIVDTASTAGWVGLLRAACWLIWAAPAEASQAHHLRAQVAGSCAAEVPCVSSPLAQGACPVATPANGCASLCPLLDLIRFLT